MNGIGESTFAPDGVLTRAMFVTVLHRFAGTPKAAAKAVFADVADGVWYADSVAWACENGIVKGVSETEFAPDAFVTREQMALILSRYAAKDTDESKETAFDDIATLSEESRAAIEWAFAAGILNGMTETTFAPSENATRAQAAAIFVRFAK